MVIDSVVWVEFLNFKLAVGTVAPGLHSSLGFRGPRACSSQAGQAGLASCTQGALSTQDCPQPFSHCFINHFVVSLRSGVSVAYDNSDVVSRLCHCVLIKY